MIDDLEFFDRQKDDDFVSDSLHENFDEDIAFVKEDEFVDRIYKQIAHWATCELSGPSAYDWETNNMARIKRGIRSLLKEKLND